MLPKRHLHILGNRERGKKRPVLKQHSPFAAGQSVFLAAHLRLVAATNLNHARHGVEQTDNGAQQHGLTGARAFSALS